MRELSNVVIQRKNKQAPIDPFVWLIELFPNSAETVYLTNDNMDVVFDSKLYRAFPFEVGEYEHDSSGNISELRLVVGNQNGEMGAIVERNRGFAGREVVMRLVVLDTTINDTYEAFSVTFQVKGASYNDDAAVFPLGKDSFAVTMFPRGKLWRERCRFAYKGPLCGFSGALPTCDRALRSPNGCEAHVNEGRFGGAPGIPK